MLPRSVRFATSLTILTTTANGAAQVNAEALRGDFKNAPVTATLDGSFTGSTGNVQGVVAGVAATAASRWDRHRGFASASADYAQFGEKTTISKSFVHIRYNYELLYWLAAEAFAQQQQNEFQRLLLRELVGTGPRFVLVDEEEIRLACGTAYMLEFERIDVQTGAPDPPETVVNRSSSYLAVTYRFDDRVKALSTFYVQPRFDRPSDFRMLSETALVTTLKGRFGVKLSVTLRHDSEPPTGVKQTDGEVKNAFSFTF